MLYWALLFFPLQAYYCYILEFKGRQKYSFCTVQVTLHTHQREQTEQLFRTGLNKKKLLLLNVMEGVKLYQQ